MKTTIYELLGLVKDGKAPKKIKYNNIELEYDEKDDDYYSYYGGGLFEFKFSNCLNFLNDEVEIVDDEEWKTIEDFPNYEISTKGNIRTKEYCDGRNHIRQSKLLNKQINNVGYEYVILSNETVKHKTLTVHRLMARAFLNDYFDTLDVNHINGIKTDNRIENLEMTTHSENIKKRYETGNDGNNYKAVNQYDLDGNYIATYKSSYEAEKITGIGRTCIGGCCRKERHTAGGYVWKFVEEDKKIEKITVREKTLGFPNGEWTARNMDKALAIKINELIDEINNLKYE